VLGSCFTKFGVTVNNQSLELDIYLIHVSRPAIMD
jgi:hypothetical protein